MTVTLGSPRVTPPKEVSIPEVNFLGQVSQCPFLHPRGLLCDRYLSITEVTFSLSFRYPTSPGSSHLYRFPSSPWGRPRPPNIHKVASGPSTMVCPRRCRKRLAVS